mmetsp:Transcript_14557/g.25912  ORF Transcript_14557/g.25912 Transcript_14557/m.25912 type:complete len:269 (+) Transcript_14557:27283-28089(+)
MPDSPIHPPLCPHHGRARLHQPVGESELFTANGVPAALNRHPDSHIVVSQGETVLHDSVVRNLQFANGREVRIDSRGGELDGLEHDGQRSETNNCGSWLEGETHFGTSGVQNQLVGEIAHVIPHPTVFNLCRTGGLSDVGCVPVWCKLKAAAWDQSAFVDVQWFVTCGHHVRNTDVLGAMEKFLGRHADFFHNEFTQHSDVGLDSEWLQQRAFDGEPLRSGRSPPRYKRNVQISQHHGAELDVPVQPANEISKVVLWRSVDRLPEALP